MLKRLYHISDIHIRLIKRHDEYRIVFKNLYNELRTRYNALHDGSNDPSALIVVTGDVIHTKTDMSPEMVALTSEFFLNLSDIAPVVVIPGNHDVNLNSPNRLDALTPILSNINRSNIHYLRTSQRWSHYDPNISFYHYSLIDNVNIEIQKDDTKKIGLFHGAVSGASTDQGYEIPDKSHLPTIEQFRGLDLVLLGDIHRYQILQKHKKDATGTHPEIAYASSLIQQNYGETLDYHGFIEWNLESLTHEFIEVPNEYGFVTVALNDGVLVENENVTYPSNIRLRFLVQNSTMKDIKTVEREFRKKHKLLEVVYKMNESETTNDICSDMANLYDVDEQEERIRSYLSGWPEQQIEDLLALNVDINARITPDDSRSGGLWKLKSLYFDNMFSYGKGNFINFENIHGINGLFAPNASGKSSLINILCFALYDKTPRVFKGNHIINSRSDECYCQLLYTFGDETYRIERRGKNSKTGSVKFDVDFSKLENDEWISLNGKDRRDTNRVIREYIGSFDDLLLTTLSTQNQDGMFVNLGQTDRRDVLSRFLGLSVFPKLESQASLLLKELEVEKKVLAADDIDHMIEELTAKEKRNLQIISESTGIITSRRRAVESYQKMIRDAAEKKIPIAVVNNIDELLQKRDQLEKLIYLDGVDITETESRLVSLQAEREQLEQKSLKLSELEKQFTKEYLMLLDKQREKDKECIQLQTSIDGLQLKIDNLLNYEFDPNCKFCISNVFVQEAYAAQNDIKTVEEMLQNSKQELILLEEKLQEKKYLEEAHQEWGGIVNELLITTNTISKLQEHLNVKKLHRSATEESLTTTLQQITQYHSYEKDVLKNSELDKLIDMYEGHLQTSQKDVSKFEGDLSRATVELETIRERLEYFSVLQEKVLKLDASISMYKLYLTVVGNSGLPYNIISSYVQRLETSINSILSNVVDFRISITADDKLIGMDIVYDDQRRWALELGSGMEQFVTGIAIRIALSEISTMARGNFFVVDEGFGTLDAENRQTIHKLFGVLQDKYDIVLLISHLDIVRDITERHITVDNDLGWSKILVK